MDKVKLFIFLGISFCVLFLMTACSVKQKKDTLLKLWYEQPAQKWTEALPVGNGRIGAMVFGGVDTAQFQLNDATLWSGYPKDGNNSHAKEVLPKVRKALFDGDYAKAQELCKQMMGPYVATYLTLGSLYLYFNHSEDSVAGYTRSLNLENALAGVSFKKGNIHYSRQVFSSYPDQLLAIHLEADQEHAISFSTGLNNPMPHHIEVEGENAVMMRGFAPSYVAHRSYDERQIAYDSSKAMPFAVMLKAEVDGGKVIADTTGLIVKDASEVTLYLSTGTGFVGYNKMPSQDGYDISRAKRNLWDVEVKPYNYFLQRHKEDYQSLFNRVHLNLGLDSLASLPTDIRLKKYTQKGGYSDPQLTTLLFQYGRYLMIAGSRPALKTDKIYGRPMNLQGIWNRSMKPPWGSNYTMNINTEMNYWPAEKNNLSE
ncbi:MAG TPA: glycoside hydrolase family 95 protein, partial [Chitinophagaceae bacterium]|nr:glycoside hydrolase family 95 protein [Chitinophagaceae bacterium]